MTTRRKKNATRSVLVLPDLHIPHHDPAALDCVLQAYNYLKPQEVVVLGDWLDCEQFSSHPKSSFAEVRAHRFFEDELEPCIDVLNKLQKFGNKLVFVEGNHEQRIERWSLSLGNRLGQDIYKMISPYRNLAEGRKKFVWVPYKSQLAHYEIAPDLWALHGWSFAKSAARIHQDRAVSVSVVYGHTHRQQSEARRDPATGRVLKAWSPGCLSKLQPLYAQNTPTSWVQGFSIVYVGKDTWTDYTVTIQQGTCVLPDGKLISARGSHGSRKD